MVVKYKDTFLSLEDVKQAYLVANLMSDYPNMMRVLHKELNERIVLNKELDNEKEVKKWIAQEKRDKAKQQKEAKEWNDALDKKKEAGEYVDINDYYFVSPGPNAITYLGVTVCGHCFGRKEEPKGDCYSHYWDKN